MKTAFEIFQKEFHKPKLTTGNTKLDVLIGEVKLGQFYLFYSESSAFLDQLVHRVLVNCLLPIETGGFSSKALYFNVCNYHKGKTLLDPSYLAMFSKQVGLDPKFTFKNIYAVSVFNEMQQATATSEIITLLSHDDKVKLIVIHNLTRFIETSSTALEARQVMKKTISRIRSVAYEQNIALIASCGAKKSHRYCFPQPTGGRFLYQEANIIVYLTPVNTRRLSSVKVTLTKHPYKETPHSIVLYTPPSDRSLKGLITSSFSSPLQRIIETLGRKTSFQNSLWHLKYQQALDLLLKNAWLAEIVALSKANIPSLLDALNLMASIHNKKCLEALSTRILELKKSRET
ncbi:MAG: hypothetical protein ACXACF_00370 [Candidatus Hermodarchaeia archaeon]|jgi:hypothetical protein